MMCDGADWYIRGVFLGPATAPLYAPAPSAPGWLDKDAENQELQLTITNVHQKSD